MVSFLSFAIFGPPLSIRHTSRIFRFRLYRIYYLTTPYDIQITKKLVASLFCLFVLDDWGELYL